MSEFAKRQLVERLGVSEGKIKVIYEGVERKELEEKFARRERREVLEKWGIGERYLLFVGTVQLRKNLEYLISVYRELRKEFLGLQLVIAGKKGWSCERAYKLTDEVNSESIEGVTPSVPGVILTERVSEREKRVLLQNAEVYVQPSIMEGFGLPVLEAMASGVPVVRKERDPGSGSGMTIKGFGMTIKRSGMAEKVGVR